MKSCVLLVMLSPFSLSLFAQLAVRDTVYSPVTTTDAKAQRHRYLLDTTIRQYLEDPLNDDNEGEWNEAFWSIELLVYKNDFIYQ